MPLCLCAFKPFFAQMAKLVDALVSGTSVSNDVQVRVLFWAQKTVQWRKGSTAQRLDSIKFFSCSIVNVRSISHCAIAPLCLLAFLRPDGEIGRHASLRGWCSQGCASSSLVLGTNDKTRLILQSGFSFGAYCTGFMEQDDDFTQQPCTKPIEIRPCNCKSSGKLIKTCLLFPSSGIYSLNLSIFHT